MVDINIDVNVFTAFKFIAIEVLISYALEPGWEFIIRRTAHARGANDERVTVATLSKLRSFPCVQYLAVPLSLSPFSRSEAVYLRSTQSTLFL